MYGPAHGSLVLFEKSIKLSCAGPYICICKKYQTLMCWSIHLHMQKVPNSHVLAHTFAYAKSTKLSHILNHTSCIHPCLRLRVEFEV